MKRVAWFAGGMVAGVALVGVAAVAWFIYGRDDDDQEFAG